VGYQTADIYKFFYGQGCVNHHGGTGYFIHSQKISAVKRIEFVSDGMSYINVKVRLCDIIVLNMHILRIKMMLKRTVFMKK